MVITFHITREVRLGLTHLIYAYKMKKRRSYISVKLANISGLRLCRKKPFRGEEEVLVGFDAVGHSGSYIQ
jgi:hypothetical protein